MNLTHCSSKISNCTGNYLNFNNNNISEEDEHEIYTSKSGGSLKKENSKSKKKSRSSYMCRKCRAHGHLLPVKNHRRNCPFKICPCPLCTVVSHGRDIVARQIRLYRNQRDTNKRAPQSPHCRRCRNHGEHNAWKGHKKKCRHSNCPCKLCLLITMRKSNEKSYREIIQEVNEDKTIKTTPNFINLKSRETPVPEEQSLLIRNITRPSLLPTCSTLYDGMSNNSIYAQPSVLNFQPTDSTCPIKSFNWPSPYKIGSNSWEPNGAFDAQHSNYCNNANINNMVFNSNGSLNHGPIDYLPSTSSTWYSNFY